MRTITLFFSCLISISLCAQIQPVREQICNHVWQETNPLIVWSFRDSGDFSAFHFWKKKDGFGFTAKKGTFRLDDSAKILHIIFDSTYSVFAKDSFLISKDIGRQVWDLVTVTDSKMVISRPPVWEFEKRTNVNVDKNIIVTLRGKKNKKGKKQKV